MDTSLPAVVLAFHHGSLGIARSLGRLGVAVHGVDAEPDMPAMSSRYVRQRLRWDVHGAPAEATVDWLLALGERLGEAVLIPTSDPAALLVAEHADALGRRFRFQRNAPALIRSFSDKKALFFLAQRHGVPTAAAAFPSGLADVRRYLEQVTFPVMLKGIDGMRLEARTGKKMWIVRSADELLRTYERMEDPAAPNLMLQEYIPGGDDTIWMFNGYFDERSECRAAFTGRKLRQHPVHTGSTSLGVQTANPEVARLTADFMKAVGYHGVLDVGYRYDARDGRYKLLDPNPRIGQTFRLFLDRAGLDVARYAYLDLTGQPLPPAEPVEGRLWVVENNDFESCLAYRREGQLTLARWLASYRGLDEGAWWAWDDPVPFARMLSEMAGKAAAYARRSLRRPSATASSPAGRRAACR